MSPKLPILLSALLALPPAVRGDPAAAPGLMIVTTLEDAGAGSLREALETLNAGGIGEVDLRSVHGEIRLRSALPEVRQNVRLLGPDPARGRLLINGQGQWPILAFAAGSTSELHHLVLTNALATGYRHGAALSNAGVLLLASCEISGNRNLFGWGGGLFNQGDLRLTDCLLRGNVASGEPGTDGDSRPLNFTFQGVTPGGGGAGTSAPSKVLPIDLLCHASLRWGSRPRAASG